MPRRFMSSATISIAPTPPSPMARLYSPKVSKAVPLPPHGARTCESQHASRALV